MTFFGMPKPTPLIIAFCWILFLTRESQAQFEFGTPTKLPDTVNSDALDFQPSISSDGLELYFTSNRNGYHTWLARRDTADGDFGPAEYVAGLRHPSISHDGLSLYGNLGGQFGNEDSVVITRANNTEPWEPRNTNLGENVNGRDYDRAPDISADGRELYFVRSASDFGNSDLFVATREDVTDPLGFGPAQDLGPDVNDTWAWDMGPNISSNGLWLFFSSNRGDGFSTPATPTEGPELQAGDADQDLDFDQLDLVQVQTAAKYLSGQPASWGEGDWNGAPGGEPGNPPVGNGFFDQVDIIAALAPGHYLSGRYAAIQRSGVTADGQRSIIRDAVVVGSLVGDGPLENGDFIYMPVPEPGTGVLLGLGLVGALLMRRLRADCGAPGIRSMPSQRTMASHQARRVSILLLLVVVGSPAGAHGQVKNWQTGETIPGTEGIVPGPGINLGGWNSDSRNLRFADFSGSMDLSDAFFYSSWLDDALLTGANLSDAYVAFSTLSNADLSGANLARAFVSSSILSNANLTETNLANTRFGYPWGPATLTGANFTGAVVVGASFGDTTSRGFTKEQLYSTASYQAKNLQRIGLKFNDLTGWDFSGQDLTNADLRFSTLTSANFTGANLTNAVLASSTLTNANLTGANLTNAFLARSTLTNANLTGAVVKGTLFSYITSGGLTKEQLYSTASYQAKNLQRIGLEFNDLTGWDFSGQDLTNADLWSSTLTSANFTGANLTNAGLGSSTLRNVNLTGALVVGAGFGDATSRGFTKEQLYSTASYQAKNLQRIDLGENDLTGWDFSGQDLTNADLASSTLTNANLSGTVVTGADFVNTTSRGFTKEQLYSTASYQSKNLQRIVLGGSDLSGWDFSGQDLTNAQFLDFDARLGSNFTDANLSGANLTNAGLARSTLTNANLTGAVVKGTLFGYITSGGLTKEQLYSTASYRSKNLQRIVLIGSDLSGWDFSGQNLAGAVLRSSTLTSANFTGANLTNADLGSSTLTSADLTGAKLANVDLSAAEGLSSAVFSPETFYNQWTRFPSDFDSAAAGLTFVESPAGDFDGDDLLELVDVEMLSAAIRGQLPGPLDMIDVNLDTIVDQDDLTIWVKDIKRTWFGDVNLDGEFNSLDIVSLLQAGEYLDGVHENSTWATGDWNADGEFDRADIALALQDGGYGQGPRAALAAVPEPSGVVLTFIGSLGLGFLGKRSRSFPPLVVGLLVLGLWVRRRQVKLDGVPRRV